MGELSFSITLSEEHKITADTKVTTATSKGCSDEPGAERKRSVPRVTGPAARRANPAF